MVQPVEILQNRVFYRGKHNFFSQEKFISLLSLGIQATDPSEGKG
jgi:hypothetical protein